MAFRCEVMAVGLEVRVPHFFRHRFLDVTAPLSRDLTNHFVVGLDAAPKSRTAFLNRHRWERHSYCDWHDLRDVAKAKHPTILPSKPPRRRQAVVHQRLDTRPILH